MPKSKKPKSKKRSAGRPSLYKPEYNDQARKLCLLGLTNEEMADFFAVNVDTVYEWQKKHPEFSEALRAGKVKADADVANKLLDRAMGAEWVEDQAFKLRFVDYENGKKVREYEKVEKVPVRRAAPPDTPAIALWLKNRQPSRWRDKPEPSDNENEVTPVKVIVEVKDARKADAHA